MTLAEIIYQHSLNLPDSAAKEALDFIEFLEQRYAKDKIVQTRHTDLADTSKQDMANMPWESKVRSLAGMLSDDFPDDIDDSDLGVDALHEDFD